MTYQPPTDAVAFIDVWKAKFFPYDTTGVLDLPGYPTPATTPYEGIEFKKVKSIAPNLGVPRQIPVTAQGSVQTTFTLPSLDPQTIEAHMAYFDLLAYAEVSGLKPRTIGGGTFVSIGTNKIGFEKKGILVVTTLAAHSADDDKDVCVSYIFTSAKATFQIPALNENPADVTVNFSLGKKKKAVWGETFTEVVDGASQANGHMALHFGQFSPVAWLADGSEDTFLLPADKPALPTFTDTFVVYDLNSGDLVPGTSAEDQFVADDPPTADDRLFGFVEIALGAG